MNKRHAEQYCFYTFLMNVPQGMRNVSSICYFPNCEAKCYLAMFILEYQRGVMWQKPLCLRIKGISGSTSWNHIPREHGAYQQELCFMERKSKQLIPSLSLQREPREFHPPEAVPKALLLPCLPNSSRSYPSGAGFFAWQRKSPSRSANHSPEGTGVQMSALHHSNNRFPSFFKYSFGRLHSLCAAIIQDTKCYYFIEHY